MSSETVSFNKCFLAYRPLAFHDEFDEKAVTLKDDNLPSLQDKLGYAYSLGLLLPWILALQCQHYGRQLCQDILDIFCLGNILVLGHAGRGQDCGRQKWHLSLELSQISPLSRRGAVVHSQCLRTEKLVTYQGHLRHHLGKYIPHTGWGLPIFRESLILSSVGGWKEELGWGRYLVSCFICQLGSRHPIFKWLVLSLTFAFGSSFLVMCTRDLACDHTNSWVLSIHKET